VETMRFLLFSGLLCLAVAYATAPLYTHKEKVENSFMVVFKKDFERPLLDQAEVRQWLSSKQIKAAKIERVWNARQFHGFSALLDVVALDAIRELPDVMWVEENGIVRLDDYLHDAPVMEHNVSTQLADWGQLRVDQRCTYDGAHTFNPCGSPGSVDCGGTLATVWIVDTGVRYTHTQFHTSDTDVKLRASLAADYATGDPDPWNGDCNGHGTHCAGSAAGLDWGIAPAALIKSVRVLNCQGSGTFADVASGFTFVANNQDAGRKNIMSVSLGGGYSASTNLAIEEAAMLGVIPVVAAGNSNSNVDNFSPASAQFIICVGATGGTNDARATYSNYGAKVDNFAPGSNILSAWYTSDTATAVLSGTSMATPLTSGAIAVIPGAAHKELDVHADIVEFASQNVVVNPGPATTTRLIYDRWNDGTDPNCLK